MCVLGYFLLLLGPPLMRLTLPSLLPCVDVALHLAQHVTRTREGEKAENQIPSIHVENLISLCNMCDHIISHHICLQQFLIFVTNIYCIINSQSSPLIYLGVITRCD